MHEETTLQLTWPFLIGSAWIMLFFGWLNQLIYNPRKRPIAYAASIPGFYLVLLLLVKILS